MKISLCVFDMKALNFLRSSWRIKKIQGFCCFKSIKKEPNLSSGSFPLFLIYNLARA